jgi:hypothetical protein
MGRAAGGENADGSDGRLRNEPATTNGSDLDRCADSGRLCVHILRHMQTGDFAGGFSALIVVLGIVAILAIIGFVAFRRR